MEKGAMSIYECFFFSNGHVGYFENLECDNEASLRLLFQKLISGDKWDAAEAWRHEKLVCRVIRFANGRIDCSVGCPAFLSAGEYEA
jgi:hypothetical protein